MQRFVDPHVSSERRYDAAELQQIIGIATRYQQQHNETLDSKQVEQLGAELGISAEHIRQALQLLTEAQSASQGQLAEAKPVTNKRTQLSKATFLEAVVPSLLASLPALIFLPVLVYLHWYRIHPRLFPMIVGALVVVVPVVRSVMAGWNGRQVGVGVLGGAVAGFMAWVGGTIAVFVEMRGHHVGFWDFGLPFFFLMTGVGALLGGFAAVVRQWWDSRPATEDDVPHLAR